MEARFPGPCSRGSRRISRPGVGFEREFLLFLDQRRDTLRGRSSEPPRTQPLNASRRPKPTPPASRRSAPAASTFSTRSLGLLLAAGLALAVAYYLANHLAKRKAVTKAMPAAVQVDMVRGGMPVGSVSTQDAAARGGGTAPVSLPRAESEAIQRPGPSETPPERSQAAGLAPQSGEAPESASGVDLKTPQDPGQGASASGRAEGPAAGAAIYRCRQGQSVVFSQWPCDPATSSGR